MSGFLAITCRFHRLDFQAQNLDFKLNDKFNDWKIFSKLIEKLGWDIFIDYLLRENKIYPIVLAIFGAALPFFAGYMFAYYLNQTATNTIFCLFVAATLAYATLGVAWLIGYVLVKHFGFKRKGKQNDFL